MKKLLLLLIIPLLVFLGCYEAQYCRNDCNKKCKAQVCRNIEDVGYYTNANLTSIQMYTSELIFVPAKFRKNYGWEITRYSAKPFVSNAKIQSAQSRRIGVETRFRTAFK